MFEDLNAPRPTKRKILGRLMSYSILPDGYRLDMDYIPHKVPMVSYPELGLFIFSITILCPLLLYVVWPDIFSPAGAFAGVIVSATVAYFVQFSLIPTSTEFQEDGVLISYILLKNRFVPYSEFQSIRHTVVTSGHFFSAVTPFVGNYDQEHLIELSHHNKRLTVPLCLSAHEPSINTVIERYAERFKLPIIELDDGQNLERPFGTHDVALHEKQAGSSTQLSTLMETKPRNISVETRISRTEPNHLLIHITPAYRTFMPHIMVSTLILFMVGMGLADSLISRQSVMFAGYKTFGAFAFVILFFIWIVNHATTCWQFVLTDNAFFWSTYDCTTGSDITEREGIFLDQIEMVRVAQNAKSSLMKSSMRSVVITSDDDNVSVADGLSRRTQRWLRDFLKAYIVIYGDEQSSTPQRNPSQSRKRV